MKKIWKFLGKGTAQVWRLLKKLWKLADGNKTIFGSLLLAALEAGLIPVTGGWLVFLKWAVRILTGAALGHHIQKGYFSPKKGD